MPKRKKAIKFADRGEKELWHPYGLQGLSTDQFAQVVNRILRGRFHMLGTRYQASVRDQTVQH